MDALNRVLSRKWAPAVVGVLIALLLAGIFLTVTRLVSAAEGDPTAIDCSDDSRATVAEASAVAKACEIDVEVLEERTPWETSWVTAEGTSRLDVTASPTSTNVNGQWEDIDPTISDAPNADGMMPATAPVNPTAFNPGGEAGEQLPLAEIEREGKTLKMWLPLPLGDATFSSTSATYALFGGASLTVYVNDTGTGFRPVLKLDTPEAASEFKDRLATARAAGDLPGTGWPRGRVTPAEPWEIP
jgi:hypothetical protein